MPRDEPRDLEELRRIWGRRLEESAEPAEMTAEEWAHCIGWLEQATLDGILLGWFYQGRISMRWDALEGKPKFDAR